MLGRHMRAAYFLVQNLGDCIAYFIGGVICARLKARVLQDKGIL